jgi:hypothetical protein
MEPGGDHQEHEIRIISIYATRWRRKWDKNGQSTHLALGRLEEFYSLYEDQLPRALLQHVLDPAQVTFTSVESERPDFPDRTSDRQIGDDLTITHAEVLLFALPSDQVVAAVDLEFQSPPLHLDAVPTINVLEHSAYAQVRIEDMDLESYIAAMATAVGASAIDTSTLLPPERHQVVFASHQQGGTVPDEATIGLLLYRADPPCRPQFMEVRRPPGLNVDNGIGAVTPDVSLLYGQPDYVENSVFLTAVQAVGTAARFRQIWHRAHGRVRDYRYNGQDETVGTQRKSSMEFLADELGNLELDLSFSVEASADLGLLVPSVRIESFHKALYEAMELRQRADTVSRMFSRLDASIRSELTAIDIRDQQAEEEKHLRRSAAISVIGFVGAPLSFLLGFFGISGR